MSPIYRLGFPNGVGAFLNSDTSDVTGAAHVPDESHPEDDVSAARATHVLGPAARHASSKRFKDPSFGFE